MSSVEVFDGGHESHVNVQFLRIESDALSVHKKTRLLSFDYSTDRSKTVVPVMFLFCVA